MTTPPNEATSARGEELNAVRARLHAFIARRVEGADVAEDLTQEVLLRLHVASTDGQSRLGNPTAWLYRVARNVLIDHYRTRTSHRRRADATDLAAVGLVEDPFADDPRAAQRELAGCLRSLVGQLAEPYRTAVAAVDLDGHAQTDLAHTLGLSVSGMKSRVQRGRRQLGQLLTQCCQVHTGPTGSITGYEPISGCDPPAGTSVRGRGRCAATPP